MILKQFYLNCLAHASYVVADEVGRVREAIEVELLENHEPAYRSALNGRRAEVS